MDECMFLVCVYVCMCALTYVSSCSGVLCAHVHEHTQSTRESAMIIIVSRLWSASSSLHIYPLATGECKALWSKRQRESSVWAHAQCHNEWNQAELANTYIPWIPDIITKTNKAKIIHTKLASAAMGKHWNIHKGMPSSLKTTYSMVAGQCTCMTRHEIMTVGLTLATSTNTYIHVPGIWLTCMHWCGLLFHYQWPNSSYSMKPEMCTRVQ